MSRLLTSAPATAAMAHTTATVAAVATVASAMVTVVTVVTVRVASSWVARTRARRAAKPSSTS